MTKVIEINNLSKVYDLGLVGTGTLSKDLNRAWARLRGKPDPYATLVELNDRTQKSSSNMVYALKDINFSVEQGEVLGIIGKNGAGKSTLLKILSQITSPSTGIIKMRGRVASLLEVGTGMHPEMTARENIYLNGSLMGMRRYEITYKLDEIVHFAGIEKYLDTPIKRFSSGMKVRLGFAIAAFLEPEILIVDEVSAVGDAAFQKKAIGKMQEVSKGEGRTVLFVSHNLTSIQNLCTSAIVLKFGSIDFAGTTYEAIGHYLDMGKIESKSILRYREDRKGDGYIKFIDGVLTSSLPTKNKVLSGERCVILLTLKVFKELSNINIVLVIYDSNENAISTLHTRFKDFLIENIVRGESLYSITIPKLDFAEGNYFVSLRVMYGSSSGASGATVSDYIENAIVFEVIDGNFFGTGQKVIPKKHGNLLLNHQWKHEK